MKKIKLNIFDIFILIGILLIIGFGMYYHISFFEIFVSVFGVVAGLINSKGYKFYLYTYAAQSLMYGLCCFISKQYGLAIISGLFCFGLYLVSIIKSLIKKNKENGDKLIKLYNTKYYINISILTIIIGIIYFIFLRYLGSKFPLLNTLASLFCIIATYFASLFYIDQWLFWFLYSGTSMIIWLLDFKNASSEALVYLIMNICFFIINISGSIIWINKYKNQKN